MCVGKRVGLSVLNCEGGVGPDGVESAARCRELGPQLTRVLAATSTLARRNLEEECMADENGLKTYND